ncbi:transposase for insertion sequence-like element IS431mec, partial [Staphylococcus aureus DAR5806]
QDHRHIKVRKTRYQSVNTAKNTLKGIECIYGLYKKTVGLFRSTDFRHATKLGIC